jgi:hypothetical protein
MHRTLFDPFHLKELKTEGGLLRGKLQPKKRQEQKGPRRDFGCEREGRGSGGEWKKKQWEEKKTRAGGWLSVLFVFTL